MRRCGLLLAGLCLALPSTATARTDVTGELPRLDVPRELRVVSYYPADAGWTRMWEPWRPARLAKDLGRLRALNANTVRIVLPARFFGYPEPERRYLERLRELVGIAERSGLHVHFTLFDWWGEYGDVEGSKRWARAVLEPYVGDPRVAFVELRNEIDVHDEAALAWTRELIPWLRTLLRGQTPVTVSVGGMTPAPDLRALVAALPAGARPDFFDAHYFTGGGERARQVFSTLRDVAAPTPLWIGELGYPTSRTVSGYAGVPSTPSAQEAAQAHFYKLCFAALAGAGLAPPGLWTLDDFAPGAIPGSDVDQREPEYHFGLFRENGSAKPAAALVPRLFSGWLDTSFNGGFEAAVVAADGVTVPALWGSEGGLRLVRDATAARSGRAAALIAGRRGGTGVFGVTPVVSPVEPGRRAEATVWLRGAGGTVRLAIAWFDAEQRAVGQSRTDVRPGRGWRKVTVEGAPPASAEFARLRVRASDLRGKVWLDDVSFRWLP